MKNNVLNTLLIAFFLIGGWTLFTIWQDLRNTDGVVGSGYIISRSKNYLPILPKASSDMNSLPVYKGYGYNTNNRKLKQSNHRGSAGGQFFSNSAFDISQPTASGNFGPFSESGGATGVTGRRSSQANNQTSVAPFTLNAPRGLFSRNTTGLLAKEGTGGNNQTQGSISGSSLASGAGGPMKVFGEGEGDPLEGGGGNENLNEYNDNSEVPVGGGLVILMAFAGIYALFRRRLNIKV